MTNTGRDALTELRGFRGKLEEWARGQLERENPRYVQVFSQRLAETGDVSGVMEEAAHLLGPPPHWYPLLTAQADTELALDKVTRAVWFLAVAPQAGPGEVSNPGAWVVYHFDQWTFAAYALLERLRKLIQLTIRKLVRARNPQWRDVQAALLDTVDKMRKELGKVRHPLTHGGGGGIKGPEDERFWEPYLVGAIGLDIDLPQALYQSVQDVGYQKRWHGFAEGITVMIIANMEAIYSRLSSEAFGDP